MKYGLILSAVLMLGNAFATAATTGSIVLSGTVPARTSITVTPSPGYNDLDLEDGVNNKTVATVTEYNNTQNGYTVTVSSANAGQLKGPFSVFVPYTARYNGFLINLSGANATVTSQGAQTGVVSASKLLNISISPQSDLVQGTYSDTLTFSITAN